MSELAAACPKCGRARAPGAEACPRCGLIYARWGGGPAAIGAPTASSFAAPLDEAAMALWADVEGSWDDDRGHDRFVKHCAAAGLLAAAGRQYRAVLDRGGGDDQMAPMALRMQQRILTMASLALGAHRQAPQPVTRSPWFLVFVGLAVLGGTVGALLYVR